MTEQGVITGIDERFHWGRLRKKEQVAVDVAAAEAHELARIVAAHTIVVERDAVIAEFDERHRTLSLAIWPDDVLDGYGMHSSLGAFVLAKVAIGWVPAGHTGHRHEPLRPDLIVHALTEQGVDDTTARSVVGDFRGVEPGFRPSPKGLDVSVIAGLAERSLMRAERLDALSQVAFSPRCLHRLAATCNLVASVRALLPWLPSPRLGPEVVTGFAALALGRADRVADLLGAAPSSLMALTLVELADVQARLERQEVATFEHDPDVELPEFEPAPEAHARPASAEEDDIVEIVEERPISAHDEGGIPSTPVRLPVPSTWARGVTPLDVQTLEAWREALGSVSALIARRGALLGFKLPPAPDTVAPTPIPPDAKTLRAALERVGGRDRLQLAIGGSGPGMLGSSLEAVFPGVRAVLRVIARAPEGASPSEDAVRSAGDFAWLMARARALAKVVIGDLDAALDAVSNLPIELAPEGRWARDRRARFGGRAVEPAAALEARPVAALLVGDLAQQLARTLAGTVVGRGP